MFWNIIPILVNLNLLLISLLYPQYTNYAVATFIGMVVGFICGEKGKV